MDTQEQTGRYRILNRDAIKYIAMFTMLLYHIAQIFMAPGAFWTLVLTDVGYFTAPVMVLVPGGGVRLYPLEKAVRPAAGGLCGLSELPFCLAFTHGAVLSYYGMNLIFTLLLCFLILVADEKIRSRSAPAAGEGRADPAHRHPAQRLEPAGPRLHHAVRLGPGSRTRAKWAFFWAVSYSGGCSGWVAWPCRPGTIWRPAWAGRRGVALAAVAILYLYNAGAPLMAAALPSGFSTGSTRCTCWCLGLLRVSLM